MVELGPTLTTARLVLRPPRQEDFEAWAACMADPEAQRYLGGAQPASMAWRAMATMTGAWVVRGFSMFSVLERDGGRWIGRIGPWQPEGWPGTEVGWGLVRDVWGRGYALEAAIACMDFAFDHLGWDDAIHTIDPDNAPSIRLAERLGSKRRGPVKMPAPLEASVVDVYGQTAQEWRARRKELGRGQWFGDAGQTAARQGRDARERRAPCPAGRQGLGAALPHQVWESAMDYRVAVVGATGNVGREMLVILDELKFPVDKLHAVASRRSIGLPVDWRDGQVKCEDIDTFDFSAVDIVLMSAGGDVSKAWSEKIGRAGAVVIDNSSAWRMHSDVPLIVPEVNPDAIEDFAKKNIIANPNCSTAQLVVALKPLHDAATIRRVVVSTYQSVSGTGKAGMDELWNQTKNVFVLGPTEPKVYPKQIAFNVIPHGGDFMEDGYTTEEWKMTAEVKKILDPKIKLTATCVRVPVFVGHSESVNIEFERELDEDDARDLLRESPGVVVVDKREAGGYMTPKEAQGEFAVYVSRIRTDPTVENGLALWCVSDNLRKGAALNAVQIAQLLDQRGLLARRRAA